MLSYYMKNRYILKYLIFVLIIMFLIPFNAGCDREYKKTKFLMNTMVEITVVGNKKDCENAMELAFKEIERIDKLMNVYDPESEVSAINKMANDKAFFVSKDILEVVSQAIAMAKLTDGALDISVFPLIALWDFGGNTKRIPSADEIKEKLKLSDYKKIILDEKNSTIKLDLSGMQIDLSSIAAGYSADKAIQVLKKSGIRNALVNAGGEIYALGSPPGRNGWRIGIRHPRQNAELLGVIEIKDKAIVTSGDYENFFEIDGKRYCHIINPKTGWPVEGVMSVTILAKTATKADALATALFPMGADKGLRLVESLENVDCIIVTGNTENDMKVLLSSGIKDKVKLKVE